MEYFLHDHEVIVTADFETWWDGLGVEEQKSVAVVVAMLEERGAALPFPYSSGIAGSSRLRELRVQHGANRTGYSMPLTPNAMQSCCWVAIKRGVTAGMTRMSRRRRSFSRLTSKRAARRDRGECDDDS